MIPGLAYRRIVRRVILVFVSTYAGISASWVFVASEMGFFRTLTAYEAYLLDAPILLSVSIFPTLATVAILELEELAREP